MAVLWRAAGAVAVQLALVAVALVAPSAAAADYQHVVARGETLTSVAAQDGLSVAALAAANGLATTAELITGSVLEIPPQTAASAAPADETETGTEAAGTTTSTAAPTSTVAVETTGYIVQPGDTLTAIAERDGTTVAALAATNGLDPNGILLAGATLKLPTAVVVSSSTAAAGSSSNSVTTADGEGTASSTAAPPYPTHEYASAAEIAQIAASNGVPASLAQAIGWQESGFNNDEVSSAGAVGVMQITPGTWSWINQNLTDGTTLAPASAYSNVTGGVLLLRSLLADTGSESLAAAGYYQGLSSVRQVGMYSSTQQYVADVLALAQHFGG